MRVGFLICALFFAGNLAAQPFSVVKDINTSSAFQVSVIESMVELNGNVYYSARSPEYGSELWKMDEATGKTELVKDIYPGKQGFTGLSARAGENTGIFVYKNLIFFSASDGATGEELWKSDGTRNGTTLVKDISPGTNSSYLITFTICRDLLFFSANGELWKTDGTEQGTMMIKDIYPGNSSSFPAEFCVLNDILYFAARDSLHGRELWRSDGTEAGTYMVRDINNVVTSENGPRSSNPAYLRAFNGYLYFQAMNNFGAELWKSDGTEQGTQLLKDIKPGASSSYPQLTNTVFNNKLFFSITSNYIETELWATNGTSAGTARVKSFHPNAGSSTMYNVVNVNGSLFFQVSFGGFMDIWKSDGTETGTQVFLHLLSHTGIGLVADEHHFYFTNASPETGDELWLSDGTIQGTKLLKDIEPGPTSSYVQPQFLNGQLYFVARTSSYGLAIWKSDGTPEGTVVFGTFLKGTNDSKPSNLIALKNDVFFSAYDTAHGEELWKSDGTQSGTSLLKDILPGKEGSDLDMFIVSDSTLYFRANGPGPLWRSLWKSDGTIAGTHRVHPTVRVLDGNIIANNGLIYFAGDDGTSTMLWKSDGSEAGTIPVPDASTTGYYNPSNLTAFKGTIFFSTSSALCMLDTTSHAAVLIKDFGTTGGIIVGYGYTPVVVGNYLYFVAYSHSNGVELWKSDGTAEGTSSVLDVFPGPEGSNPNNLTAVGSELYFIASDSALGRELWKTDGTVSGTFLVKDITKGSEGTQFSNLINLNGTLFFDAPDPLYGLELRKSDGTSKGTVVVRDCWQGPQGSLEDFNAHPAVLDGNLVLTRNNGVNGEEPWLSNGTEEGTMMIADLVEGSGASSPNNYVVAGSKLFFTAYSPLTGVELWAGSIKNIYPKFQLLFDGKLVNNNAILDWQTTHERSIDRFEIQRSTNRVDFLTIGQMKANGGLGIHASYDFLDSNVNMLGQPNISYRLNMKDNAGESLYSDTILLTISHPLTDNSIKASPIPSHNEITLAITLLQPDNIDFVIYDLQGRVMMKWRNHFEKGFYTRTVNLQHLNAGVYYLNVQGTSLQQLIKLIKL